MFTPPKKVQIIFGKKTFYFSKEIFLEDFCFDKFKKYERHQKKKTEKEKREKHKRKKLKGQLKNRKEFLLSKKKRWSKIKRR